MRALAHATVVSLSVLSLEYFDGAMDGIAVLFMDSAVVSSRSSSGHKTNSDVFKWSSQSFRTIDDFLGVWGHLEAIWMGHFKLRFRRRATHRHAQS